MVEVLPIVSTILTSINVVSTLGRENERLQGKIEGSLGRLKSEVRVAEWDLAKYEAADQELTLLMQELLCDIDDFTSDLSIPEKATAFFNSLMASDSRAREIELIDCYLESIKSIGERQKEISKQGNNAATSLPSASAASYPPVNDLEGFSNTKYKFLDLLSPAHGGKLRVISIVGSGGVGKTALAGLVYQATVVHSSPTATEIHGANETTPVLPSPPSTEIHEATQIQPSPPPTEIHEPSAFDCKAWVEASTCKDAGDLLKKVLSNLDLRAAGGNNSSNAIKEFLLDKRYMVIIDDLQSCGVRWKDIEHVFPKNYKDSRVIVTTRVHSIARDYSSGRYYVYQMQCLGETNSERLFWKKVFGPSSRTPSAPEGDRSRNILSKCDGSPLALVSAGNYLCQEGNQHPYLSEDLHKAVCDELGSIAASEADAFGEMKRMFVQWYNSLTDYDHKNCLLYLSLYPRGHEIDSKDIARRLKADKLVDQGALACWKKLIDNSMIEPSPIRKKYNDAKRCKVQGMMMEFVIHMSISRNIVTLVEEGAIRPNKPDNKVRRLTVQFRSGNNEEEGSSYRSTNEEGRRNLIPQGIDPSTVRSLTIFKSKHPAAVLSVNDIDFKSFKMMRVLDLEGCKGLSGTVLDAICELLLLKYLNLKNTDVEKLPTNMKKLKRLETLDIRQTRVKTLPVEVIMLPELAHLFGEFELPHLSDTTYKKEFTKFLQKESNLETLLGTVNKKTKGFEIVIRHARKLKKVKICGDEHTAPAAASAPQRTFGFRAFFGFFRKSNPMLVAPNGSSTDLLLPSVRPASTNMVADSRKTAGVVVSSLKERFMDLDSISIDSSVISKVFLESDLNAPSIVSSIKLRGPLTSLTARTFKNLRHLNKLHLFSTGLSSKQLVEALQSLDRLEYLKLGKEDRRGSWAGDFSVQSGGFPTLQELCFEGPKIYPRLQIAEGTMSFLSSLQLLCPNLAGTEVIEDLEHRPHAVTRVEGMEHLKVLEEVILHHSTEDATVNAWRKAAKNHTSMPCVKRLPAQPTGNEHEF